MPLETQASRTAERLLILTESICDAVVADRLDEIEPLLESRRQALISLGSMSLDSHTLALLDRVLDSETNLMALLERSGADAQTEILKLYSGAKGRRAYQVAQPSQRVLHAG